MTSFPNLPACAPRRRSVGASHVLSPLYSAAAAAAAAAPSWAMAQMGDGQWLAAGALEAEGLGHPGGAVMPFQPNQRCQARVNGRWGKPVTQKKFLRKKFLKVLNPQNPHRPEGCVP